MAYSELLNSQEWIPTPEALQADELLRDGRWHHRDELSAILGKAPRIRSQLMGHPSVAESDSGEWWCIPTDETPELAPDGT